MTKANGFVVELGVADVAKSVSYYTKFLGCSLSESINDDNGRMVWAEINYDDSRAMLQEIDLLVKELPSISAEKSNRFAFVLRVGSQLNAKKLYSELKTSECIINSEPIETDYGTYEFSLLDPDGFVVLVAGRG